MFSVEYFRRYLKLAQKAAYALITEGPQETYHKIKRRLRADSQYLRKKHNLLRLDEKFLRQERAEAHLYRTRFSILVPLFNTPEAFLRDMIESVIEQTYPNWELCLADASDVQHSNVKRICNEYIAQNPKRIIYRKIDNNGISENTNVCLDMATGNYIGLLDHDDILHPSALFQVAKTITETGADFIYTDEIKFETKIKKAFNPTFKPCFSIDELRSHNYICHFTCFSRELSKKTGKYRKEYDGSQDHDMVLRLAEQAKNVVHIPQLLYFWRVHRRSVSAHISSKSYAINAGKHAVADHIARCGYLGTVESVPPFQTLYRIHYVLKNTPRVSVIPVSIKNLEQLRKTINSITVNTTYYNYEILVPSLYSESLPSKNNVRFIDKPATGTLINQLDFSYIVFLNASVSPLTPQWIEEMLMFAQREDVAAVGGKIISNHNTVLQVDITIDVEKGINRLFQDTTTQNAGYEGRLRCARNVLAVSQECMMIGKGARGIFSKIDAKAGTLWGVDFCLQAYSSDIHVVWTPFAVFESDAEPPLPNQQDILYFKTKWDNVVSNGDPYCPHDLKQAIMSSY